jgi:hypothetical protein
VVVRSRVMEDPAVPERLLAEREVSFLLRRSAQLQRQEAQAAVESHTVGDLTLSDLAEIADEIGVDPYYLERAATELEYGRSKLELATLLGGPLAIRIERTLPRELTDAEMNDLVPQIEAAAASSGTASHGPRSLFWLSDKPWRSNVLLELLVTLRSRQGRTRVGIEERLHGLIGALYGGLVGGVGVGMGVGFGVGVGVGVLDSPFLGLGFASAFIAGTFVVARETLSFVSRHRREKLFVLLDRLSERAAALDRRDAE